MPSCDRFITYGVFSPAFAKFFRCSLSKLYLLVSAVLAVPNGNEVHSDSLFCQEGNSYRVVRCRVCIGQVEDIRGLFYLF